MSIADTTHAVERTLDILCPALRGGVTAATTTLPASDFITGSLRTLGLDLVIAGALIDSLDVAFRDLRAAILCLVTIPLSLVAALAAMKLAGLLDLNAGGPWAAWSGRPGGGHRRRAGRREYLLYACAGAYRTSTTTHPRWLTPRRMQ